MWPVLEQNNFGCCLYLFDHIGWCLYSPFLRTDFAEPWIGSDGCALHELVLDDLDSILYSVSIEQSASSLA